MGQIAQSIVLPLGLPDLPFHLRLDSLSAFFLLLLGVTAAGISLFSAGYFRDSEGSAPGLLCLQYHTFLAAMALVLIADDAYVFMVAWESMALSSYFLVTTDHLQDVLAALSFLKAVPGIDSHRIAVAGHSFGGQLTLLAAERDRTVRAAVAFGAAAASWNRSTELRERLLTAVRKATAPIMLVQAENDYSTAPSRALGEELKRLNKPHLVKIYPPVGQSLDDGHNLLYKAIPQWEDDVFKFLNQHVTR